MIDIHRKFQYFCIDIIDSPFSNLLQFLPRVVKFIQKALSTDSDAAAAAAAAGDSVNSVYVHCVHGQSRSCSVCVAYLIHLMHQSDDKKFRHMLQLEQNSLHICYDKVMKARMQMAINPGFVQQLEIFRRMKSANNKTSSGMNEKPPSCDNGWKLKTHQHHLQLKNGTIPIQSQAHAFYRSSRIKSEYQYNGTLASKFSPLITQHIHVQCDSDEILFYSCQNCNETLFTTMNITHEWNVGELSTIPISDYWKESQGGLDYMNNIKNSNCDGGHRNITFESTFLQSDNIYKVEPIEWMKEQIENNHSGKLNCFNCSMHLGYWDWLNKLDMSTCVIILQKRIRLI